MAVSRLTHRDLERALQQLADPTKATFLAKFFKTGAGEYAEGDEFLGLTVPQTRAIIRDYRDLALSELTLLLQSPLHECRLASLLLLSQQAERGDAAQQKHIVDVYLQHTRFVNNWDLVDSSAPQIVGGYLLYRDRSLLSELARSPALWENRIAIVATSAFIRHGDVRTTFAVADTLLTHQHALIHKAVGWMLREAGKRDRRALETFLDRNAATMPRTMLRYAIERLEPAVRLHYLGVRKAVNSAMARREVRQEAAPLAPPPPSPEANVRRRRGRARA